MTAIREENGSWTSQFWYKDIYGIRKHKCKRGFEKKSDAETFEGNVQSLAHFHSSIA